MLLAALSRGHQTIAERNLYSLCIYAMNCKFPRKPVKKAYMLDTIEGASRAETLGIHRGHPTPRPTVKK
jgi:hypothetical protein